MRLSKEGCHKISIARCFGLNRTTLYRWGKRGKTPSLTALFSSLPVIPNRGFIENRSACVGNTLNQVFYTKQINVIWIGDISYIPTKQGWLYLAVVLDLCSRKVVGWACSDTPDTDLTVRALL